jgi:hypothetical protein
MVGHAKPSITLNVYGYLWEEQDRERELYSKLDKVFDTRPTPSRSNVVAIG